MFPAAVFKILFCFIYNIGMFFFKKVLTFSFLSYKVTSEKQIQRNNTFIYNNRMRKNKKRLAKLEQKE